MIYTLHIGVRDQILRFIRMVVVQNFSLLTGFFFFFFSQYSATFRPILSLNKRLNLVFASHGNGSPDEKSEAESHLDFSKRQKYILRNKICFRVVFMFFNAIPKTD